MKSLQIPIAFLIFNRPVLTEKVFREIARVRPSKLLVVADGPRSQEEAEQCAAARAVIEQVSWRCNVLKNYSDQNLGCKRRVSSGLDWVFQQCEMAIILEDDCLPGPGFFEYCYELLERYRHNPEILSINGFNFGYQPETSASYSFTRYMNMWGWATWRRSAQVIDYNLMDWGQRNKSLFLYTRLQSSLLDLDWKWIQRWRRTFDEVKEKDVDTWDYHWIYAGLKYRLYSIVPHRNLIRNIGFDRNATHTTNSEHPISKIETAPLKFPLTHPKRIARNALYEEEHVKKIWQLYYRRDFKYQLKSMLRDVVAREKRT